MIQQKSQKTKSQFKLGDAIARITRALHIPHCDTCEERRLILNEIQKVGMKETIKRLRRAGLPINKEDKKWSLDDIVRKMEDCCGEK